MIDWFPGDQFLFIFLCLFSCEDRSKSGECGYNGTVTVTINNITLVTDIFSCLFYCVFLLLFYSVFVVAFCFLRVNLQACNFSDS